LLPDSERFFDRRKKDVTITMWRTTPRNLRIRFDYISPPPPVEKGKEKMKIDQPIMAKVHVNIDPAPVH
jgi:hypothetical protein